MNIEEFINEPRYWEPTLENRKIAFSIARDVKTIFLLKVRHDKKYLLKQRDINILRLFFLKTSPFIILTTYYYINKIFKVYLHGCGDIIQSAWGRVFQEELAGFSILAWDQFAKNNERLAIKLGYFVEEKL